MWIWCLEAVNVRTCRPKTCILKNGTDLLVLFSMRGYCLWSNFLLSAPSPFNAMEWNLVRWWQRRSWTSCRPFHQGGQSAFMDSLLGDTYLGNVWWDCTATWRSIKASWSDLLGKSGIVWWILRISHRVFLKLSPPIPCWGEALKVTSSELLHCILTYICGGLSWNEPDSIQVTFAMCPCFPGNKLLL